MTLDDLKSSDSEFLKNLAKEAETYKAQRTAGQLSEEAYDRLVKGLTDLDGLDAACAGEITRERLAEAVEAMQGYLLGKL